MVLCRPPLRAMGARWLPRPIEELDLDPHGDITSTFMCHVSFLLVHGSGRLFSVKGQSEQTRSGMRGF